MSIERVDLDALEAAEKAATSGPWTIHGRESVFTNSAPVLRVSDCFQGRHDAYLIAEVRNALPSLIAELRAARMVVEAVKAEDQYMSVMSWTRDHDDSFTCVETPQWKQWLFTYRTTTEKALASYDEARK